ncbi:MAG: hypothetical protein ACI8RZ_004486 [Myxococcota bacterium]|jgi:hypothetical protein
MTQQAPDRLLYAGGDFHLSEWILGSYLQHHPKQCPQPKSCFTSLWRGYIACFAIRDGMLWLDEIQTATEPDDELHDHMRALLPADTPCDWFTGLIPLERPVDSRPIKVKRIKGRRQRLQPVDHPRHRLYELLQIEGGRLIRHWRLTPNQYENFLDEQRTYFRMSADYPRAREALRRGLPDLSDASFEHHIDCGIVSLTRTLFVEPTDYGQP